MEFIVLQPLQSSDSNLNISLIERKNELTKEEESLILHEAEGPYSGFVIKKMLPLNLQRYLDLEKSDLSFKLSVFLKHTSLPEMQQQEQRVLQFWFYNIEDKEKIKNSNSFFHNLYKGDNFPKDYFSFLLKSMQIFKALRSIRKIKIEIEKIGTPQPIGSQLSLKDPKQYADIISGKILEYLERAFPNAISIEELARLTNADPSLVYDFLRDLLTRGLVKYYDNGINWIRNIVNLQDEQTHEVVMVQQQPSIANDMQPSIAIITVNYYEKLAVDAMMTNKITFVRHKPEGESNVYTIGQIGDHRVVSTKLPLIGRDSRSAKISSGNTTTRLLGIFQKVEHVLLVGCSGGVANYSDFTKHPRRGDIFISFPEPSVEDDESQDFVYGNFEIQKDGKLNLKTWMPASTELYKIANNIRKAYNPKLNEIYPWEEYLEEGIKAMQSEELDCSRPFEDKLFITIGEKNIIEVNHPEDPTGSFDRRQYGQPTLRFGKIGGGQGIVKDENFKNFISEKYGIMCFDTGMDQVMESIEGNRKDSYIIVKSIVDYADGTTTKEWQPYSALCAAAFAKTVICALPPVKDFGYDV